MGNMFIFQKNNDSIGEMLRFWRQIRRISQMDLAMDAGISSKHLSFVETGKSQPSRNLILKLTQALKLPLRHRNAVLNAGGFSSEFGEEPFDGDKMAVIKQALQRMLELHNPYPAFVINTSYTLLMKNKGYDRFIQFYLGDQAQDEHNNVIRLLYADNGLKQYIKDWPVIESFLLSRLWEESLATQNNDLIRLYDEIVSKKNSDRPMDINVDTQLPIMSMTLEKDSVRASFFSMISTLGTPLDLTAQELRIESLFPADDDTRELFER